MFCFASIAFTKYVLIKAGHKCDNNLLFLTCCLHSENLYYPFVVFITECVLDNTNMLEIPIEQQRASAVRTHQSVKRCLNPLNHQFCSCGSPSTAGIEAIIHIYATLIKKSKNKNDKQNVQTKHTLHLFLNRQRCCQNYIIPTCCLPVFPIFIFLSAIKIPLWCYNEIHSNPSITLSVYAKPRIK